MRGEGKSRQFLPEREIIRMERGDERVADDKRVAIAEIDRDMIAGLRRRTDDFREAVERRAEAGEADHVLRCGAGGEVPQRVGSAAEIEGDGVIPGIAEDDIVGGAAVQDVVAVVALSFLLLGPGVVQGRLVVTLYLLGVIALLQIAVSAVIARGGVEWTVAEVLVAEAAGALESGDTESAEQAMKNLGLAGQVPRWTRIRYRALDLHGRMFEREEWKKDLAQNYWDNAALTSRAAAKYLDGEYRELKRTLTELDLVTPN